MAIVFDKNAAHLITLPNGQFMGRNVPECTITAWARIGAHEFSSVDIGTSKKGSFKREGDIYEIEGSGLDIWNTSDGFRYTYLPVTGDASLTVRVLSIELTEDDAKVGVMFRQTLDADSIHAMAVVKPDGSKFFGLERRTTTGGVSTSTSGAASPLPQNEAWLRITRAGDIFSAYSSLDGVTWTQIGSNVTLTGIGASIYVGVAVTSHLEGTLCTARFDNVALTPVAAGFERWIVQISTGASMTLSRAALSLHTAGYWRASGRRTDAEGATSLDSVELAVPGRTYFLAARFGYNLGRVDLFVDGVLNSTALVPSWEGWSDDTEPMGATIGSRANGASGYFDGVIDDVQIFHKPLTDEDIMGMFLLRGRHRHVPYVRWKLREAGSGSPARREIRDAGEAQSDGATDTFIDTYPVYADENIVAAYPRRAD